ncbi:MULTISPECIES: hypothetical protein [Methylobacillus]|nr:MULTISPECIES: hypothetical protein [Methylobacillus]MPS49560.1 hypothetical protein [Methylobacillus sp.]
MESLVAKLKIPSPHHEVEIEADGFIIRPLDDSVSAFEDFQTVAQEAMRYAGEDYEIVAHPADGAPGKFNKVYFNRVRCT